MKEALKIKSSKWAVIGLVIGILILTVLELPAPIGFETRPQNNVSLVWLALFLAILTTEIASMVFVFKKPDFGGKLGLAAAFLNVLQVIADQFHLMQPEVASPGYSLIEYAVAIISIALAYFSWRVIIDSKPVHSIA